MSKTQKAPCITVQVGFDFKGYTVEVELEITTNKFIEVVGVEWLDDVKPTTYDDDAGDRAVELLQEAVR